MKRLWILPVLVFVLCFSTSSYGKGRDNTGLYVGVGGVFGVDNFDTDELDDIAEQYGAGSVDVENEWGINGKIGYHFLPWFALEFSADYFDNFGTDSGDEVRVDADVELVTYMVTAKLVDKFYSARPYVCGGLGYMDVDAEVQLEGPGLIASESESFSDLCAKLGLGMDIFVNDHLSLGTEVAYVFGLGDVEDFRYLSWTVLQAAFHF